LGQIEARGKRCGGGSRVGVSAVVNDGGRLMLCIRDVPSRRPSWRSWVPVLYAGGPSCGHGGSLLLVGYHWVEFPLKAAFGIAW
jgi:hypothetical protein